MTVTTSLTKTSYTLGTATMQYSYGLDVLVNGKTTVDSSVTSKPVLTLTNQNGVVLTLDTTAYTGDITMPTVSGTTVLATLGGGVVNYLDGTTTTVATSPTNFNQ
jgi:hypothetical protein